MKRIVVILLVISIAGLSIFFISHIFQKSTKIEKSVDIRKSIDWFYDYIDRNERPSTHPAEYPTVMVFFNPDCEYCQYEAEVFYENRGSTDIALWYWISDENENKIADFTKRYGLNKIDHVQVLHDSTDILWQTAGVNTIPYILIYNNQGDLTHEFRGETKMEAILNAVK